MDTAGLEADGDPGRGRVVLRPRAAARDRERDSLGRQHDGRGEPAAEHHHPVAGSGRRARLSRHARGGGPVGHPAGAHHNGPAYAERVLAADEPRDRAASGRARDVQRRLPVHRRPASDRSRQPERAVVHAVRHEQWVPPQPRLRQQQSVFAAGAIELSRRAPVVRAAGGGPRPLPRLLHAVEGDVERRELLLQFSHRSVRSLEGLGARRRRPAPPTRRQRRRDWCSDSR